jgi:hypothetical protein
MTIAEIFNQMVEEKKTLPSLDGLAEPAGADHARNLLNELNTESKVSIWRLFLWIPATAIWVFMQLLDKFKVDVNTLIAARTNYGHPLWYRDEALNYQHGYQLLWRGSKYYYQVNDESAKVVKFCATQLIDRTCVVKVAGADGSGNIVQLPSAQRVGLNAYLQKIVPAGARFELRSIAPDDLNLTVQAFYDPLVLSNNGSLLSDPSRFPLTESVNNYLSNLKFNGEFSRTALVDAMQAATGIVDPILTASTARFGSNNFADTGNHYIPRAGYLRLNNLTVSYTPKNV